MSPASGTSRSARREPGAPNIGLAQEDGLMAGLMKPDLDAANTGEQSCDT